MKLKQKQSLRSKNESELDTLIREKKAALAKAILTRSDEKNTNIVRNLQQDIALMLTMRGELQ